MNEEQKCPQCSSENVYQDRDLWVCAECFHEWDPAAVTTETESAVQSIVIKDSNGSVLTDGDTVSVIKDLKVKGSASGIKSGTKVKNIRLVESSDGHNISCKVDGIGAMFLRSEFVKKV
ncbi:MAG: alkylphosphonate utilization protein [Bacteroidetes bacterium]|nr:alkylphosphonate utilization protein [Bacteroidota bacterium]